MNTRSNQTKKKFKQPKKQSGQLLAGLIGENERKWLLGLKKELKQCTVPNNN